MDDPVQKHECRSLLTQALDDAADAVHCDLHNAGADLLGNTQASDLEWLARNLFDASRLGGGDIQTIPWLIGPDQWEALGLTPKSEWGDGPRRWDQLDEVQQQAWLKLARIVFYVMPMICDRIGNRYMAQAKAVRKVWQEIRKEVLEDG